MAVHASMLPGYPIYANGQWLQDGGTSAAAPLAAAAFSTISARLQAAGKPPLGPVNGLLYWLERYRPSALYDIVSGTNRCGETCPLRETPAFSRIRHQRRKALDRSRREATRCQPRRPSR
jgi:subtilase family serine protease